MKYAELTNSKKTKFKSGASQFKWLNFLHINNLSTVNKIFVKFKKIIFFFWGGGEMDGS